MIGLECANGPCRDAMVRKESRVIRGR
jgi:hypothetical protein